MNITYQSPVLNTLIPGDSLTVLKTLPDQLAQTCVTSPPYWGLRDYGTATWEGGDENCDHQMPRNKNRCRPGSKSSTNRGTAPDSRWACRHCGARRIDQQLGLEPTPAAFVQNMVRVFREVRRVLRDDGTLWLNLGDCYAASQYGSGGGWAKNPDGYRKAPRQSRSLSKDPGYQAGLKNKNLVGIPWRVALALQADGWYLRQDIVWHKPNPMPERVRDRCTKAHEYIFLLSKAPRYYFDNDAIREAHQDKNVVDGHYQVDKAVNTAGWVPRQKDGIARPSFRINNRKYHPKGRNKHSVWRVSPKPFRGAHFATFPPELITPCILAGAPSGAVVLDPFIGSGTTAAVALQQGRRYLGIELNPAYLSLAEQRLSAVTQAPQPKEQPDGRR